MSKNLGLMEMTRYKVELSRILKKGLNGKDKTEIWANIKNMESCSTTKKLVWWEDEKGHFHDESPNLSCELRDIIDNAWIEKKRYW